MRTAVEQEMVDYIHIVDSWSRRRHQNRIGLEYRDLYIAGLMGLWKGVKVYDSSKNLSKEKFYSWRVITSIIDYMRDTTGSRMKNGRRMELYEDVLKSESEGFSIEESRMNFATPQVDIDASIDLRLLIKKSRLTKRQQCLVRLRDEGYSLDEIGEKYNITGACVCQWIRGDNRNAKRVSVTLKLKKAHAYIQE